MSRIDAVSYTHLDVYKRQVLFLKQAIDGGDGFAVLAAISHCVTSGLVAPEWLADAFNRRYASVVGFGAGSWDDPSAFGRPYPKGTNLASLRKAAKGSRAVWQLSLIHI